MARLRDPNSKQNIGSGAQSMHYNEMHGDEKMCCLVHCTFALKLNSADYASVMTNLIGADAVQLAIELNDIQKKSLPEIADWVDTLPTSD